MSLRSPVDQLLAVAAHSEVVAFIQQAPWGVSHPLGPSAMRIESEMVNFEE